MIVLILYIIKLPPCPSFIAYKITWERFIRGRRQAPARDLPCLESLLAPGHILNPSVASIPTASSYRALPSGEK